MSKALVALALLAAVSVEAGPPPAKTLAYCLKGEHAYLLGSVAGTHFTPASKLSHQAVGALQAFTLGGPGTHASGGAVKEDGIGSLGFSLTPPLSQECFLVSGTPPQVAAIHVGTSDSALRKALLKVVQAKLPGAQNVRVAQDLTVDINADKHPIELVTAESRKNPQSQEPDYTDGDYSLAAFVHRGKDGIDVDILHLDMYGKSDLLHEYRFLTVLDLTGKHHYEAVLRSTYYEGQGIEIIDDWHHQAHVLLQTGWGL